ncbi:MAG TPA: class I SAM-dependent methyltransferase, partial [Thermoanaerobaculia bacterium]|nr:class I SAM-dependent methyltransferase [Thermoanaerobaculia bacterium]
FLQPYHAAPGDYRRYTADGLAQLGRNAGLEVVEVLPVHSFAQTLGWMLWEYAAETRGWIARRVLWLIAFLLTRFRTRTDPALRKNANTFQAVFRRPESLEANVIGTEWRRKPVPAACTSVPTMLVPDELRLLNHLAEEVYRGDGAIVDGGAFLGGSTVALADGLLRNPRRWRFGAEKRIHSFDRFEVEEYMRGLFFPESTPIGTSFRAEFERNIAPVADLVEVHAGDLRDSRWNGGPIEILFIDIAKTPRTCDWITRHFFPHLIPGRSLVVQQDYLYGCWTAWLQVTMELYADCFEYVCDTEVNSVVFRNIKPVPPDGPLLRDLSIDEQSALMDRAASRFTGRKREILRAAKQHFMENVASRYDSVSGGVACGND